MEVKTVTIAEAIMKAVGYAANSANESSAIAKVCTNHDGLVHGDNIHTV